MVKEYKFKEGDIVQDRNSGTRYTVSAVEKHGEGCYPLIFLYSIPKDHRWIVKYSIELIPEIEVSQEVESIKKEKKKASVSKGIRKDNIKQIIRDNILTKNDVTFLTKKIKELRPDAKDSTIKAQIQRIRKEFGL